MDTGQLQTSASEHIWVDGRCPDGIGSTRQQVLLMSFQPDGMVLQVMLETLRHLPPMNRLPSKGFIMDHMKGQSY